MEAGIRGEWRKNEEVALSPKYANTFLVLAKKDFLAFVSSCLLNLI